MPQQMQYERIFWLEDNPVFIETFQRIADESQIPFDLAQLLSRTTFAYDFEMGREILQREKPFDLYVLDNGFPGSSTRERR